MKRYFILSGIALACAANMCAGNVAVPMPQPTSNPSRSRICRAASGRRSQPNRSAPCR